MIEKVDRVRSVRDPSRMPARTPMINAPGTMTNITKTHQFGRVSKAGRDDLADVFFKARGIAPFALQDAAEFRGILRV